MTETLQSDRSWGRGIIIGLVIAIITAAMMMIMMNAGALPLPKPLGLAFAERIVGHALPMPVGILFHAAYITFWTVVFVRFFPRRDIVTALLLAAVLWLGVLLVFFPLVGWGFAGSAISPKLIPASFMPHLLFGLLLWAIHKYARRKEARTGE